MEIYKNYGCLAAEKRIIYTYGAEQPTAVCSEKIKVEIPEGWEAEKDSSRDIILVSPWGRRYEPNDLLDGNETPCFYGYHNGSSFKIILKID